LKSMGFNCVKPSVKPGLTQKMEAERLKWCEVRKHWKLQHVKPIIWTDETAVLIRVRFGKQRVWRTPIERYHRTVMMPRYKTTCEFLFWGCYTWEEKGPCKVWGPETPAMKRAAERDIALRNLAAEAGLREEWELANSMSRMGLRNKPGRKPQWRFNEKNGRLVRRGKGGVDWYRYQTEVLRPLLFPFAQKRLAVEPRTVVCEDRAPAHRHRAQDQEYAAVNAKRLPWPGNSPDLNAIEPAWGWLKRRVARDGPCKTRAEAERRWTEAWWEMPQSEIQRWIERVPLHIGRIIELKGGNNYPEGQEYALAQKARNETRKARREYWKFHRNQLLTGNRVNDPEEAELDEEWEDEED
jgi:transposase